jgi:heptaprenyl diphosphate synthase
MQNKAKTLALCSAMLCAALALSYLEALLPLPLPLPGVKLGLANCVILLLLLIYPASYALAVSACRVLLSFLLFGNPTALMLSAAGGFLSFLTMLLLKKISKLSPVGVSVGGAAAHIVGQIAVSLLLVGGGALYYLPYLLLISILTGILNGFIVIFILKSLKEKKHIAK